MRRLVIFFLIFATILTTVFLWNELGHFDFSKKINHEKVGSYFTALGTVAAAFSVFLVYQQIKEMQNDRTAASKPDLQPFYAEFELQEKPREDGDEITSPFLLDIFNITNNDIVEREKAFIELENIGSGAAKDLKVVWKYETSNEIARGLETAFQYITKKDFNVVQEFSFVKKNERIKIIAPYQFFARFSPRVSEFSSSITTPTISYLDLRLILIYWDLHQNRTAKEYYVKLDTYAANRIRCKFETLSVGPSLISS